MSDTRHRFSLTADELLWLRSALLEGFRDPDFQESRGGWIADSAPCIRAGEVREHVLKLLGLDEVEPFVLKRSADWNPREDPAYLGES